MTDTFKTQRGRTNEELRTEYADALNSGLPFVHLIGDVKENSRGEKQATLYIACRRQFESTSTSTSYDPTVMKAFMGWNGNERTLRCTQGIAEANLENIVIGEPLAGFTVRLVQRTTPFYADQKPMLYGKNSDYAGKPVLTDKGEEIYEDTALVSDGGFAGDFGDVILPKSNPAVVYGDTTQAVD